MVFGIDQNEFFITDYRNNDDVIDPILAPKLEELIKMKEWIKSNCNSGFNLRLLLEDSKSVYRDGEKLTLFPDGTLSNTWCNNL